MTLHDDDFTKLYASWPRFPYSVGDFVEFTEEGKEICGIRDIKGVFYISKIDLDPGNWITTQPVTVWLHPIENCENYHSLGNMHGECVISVNRYGEVMTGDFEKKDVLFHTVNEKFYKEKE